MDKNIMMPLQFVFKVEYLISLLEFNSEDLDIKNACASLANHLDRKAASIDKRNAFIKYNSAKHGSASREFFRRQYLDLAHIHKDWRSDSEVSP
jgi:hypothetical protein